MATAPDADTVTLSETDRSRLRRLPQHRRARTHPVCPGRFDAVLSEKRQTRSRAPRNGAQHAHLIAEIRHALLHAEPRLAVVSVPVDSCSHSGEDAHALTAHHARTAAAHPAG